MAADCVYPPTTTQCAAQFCTDGMVTVARYCDAAGSCAAATSTPLCEPCIIVIVIVALVATAIVIVAVIVK